MSNDDLDLRGAFAKGTHSAHPALAARVRSAIVEDAEAPRTRGMWLAGAVAAALAVVIVAALLATSTVGRGPAGEKSGVPAASPSAQPAATPTAPEPTPTPGATPPAVTPTPSADPYQCSSVSGGGTGQAGVTDVRVGSQAGYDRLVIQFNAPVPQFEVRPQPGSSFVLDPSGRDVTLQGSAGVLVRVHNATPSGSYTGATDYHPGSPVLAEAREVGDFEGVFSWGLGVSGPSCLRVSVLQGPDRLVVDLVRGPSGS